jgi:putative polyhydroxyalkanoate system protein
VPDIHIHRQHHLGLSEARKVAFGWAEKAEQKFDMECTYEEGDTEDRLQFKRTGVHGSLQVTGQHFEMTAHLGFLLGAFKAQIEAEISRQLDELIERGTPPAKAPATARARTTSHQAAPKAAKATAAKKAPPKKKA